MIYFQICKEFYEKVYSKERTPKAATTEFLGIIANRKKISKEQFNLCETKISFHDIIKFINYQTNN